MIVAIFEVLATTEKQNKTTKKPRISFLQLVIFISSSAFPNFTRASCFCVAMKLPWVNNAPC